MPGPYPLPTLAAQITAAGVSAPSYADILASLQASYQAIFGSDVNLDPSTQDGQWLAVLAQGYHDCNSAVIAAYNQFSPATAVGAGLSSVVKTNGIAREAATNSTADLTITGTVGTVITNGVVGDTNGNQWALPASVTIPSSGSIIVTATCETAGAVSASAGTITNILNPTLGWQSATNAANATVGVAAETDSALRQRQGKSTSLPAQTPLDAIVAAVANVTGVTRYAPYENDSAATDSNGLPPHSISLVVEGGDTTAIATAIGSKTLGCATYGTTSTQILDPKGVPKTVNFYRPTEMRLIVNLTLTPLTGYVSTTKPLIAEAIAAWVNGLSIGYGGGIAINDLMAVAKLPAPLGLTYKIEPGALQICWFGGTPAAADLALTFNEAAGLAVTLNADGSLAAGDITITP